MNVLVYSERCKYSADILDFIDQHEELKQVTKLHNVNRLGVPRGVTRVPILVKLDGTTLIGGEIQEYLESIITPTMQGFDGSRGTTLDGSYDESMFSLNNYGSSLAPPMTKDLEARINADVKSAFKSYEPVTR
jgi:hypothetical protein